MSAFKKLKDVCLNFNDSLEQISQNLFVTKITDGDEELIAKKISGLRLLSSKYRLLHAKETALLPEVSERVQNGTDVLADYEAAVQQKVLERAVVKSVTQGRAVQALLTTPDRKLEPELIEKKNKIKARLKRLRSLDAQLRHVDVVLQEREGVLHAARTRLDAAVGELRSTRRVDAPSDAADVSDAYKKLRSLVGKLSLMRSLVARLATARTSDYDWLADRDRRARVFALTRTHYTVEYFTTEN